MFVVLFERLFIWDFVLLNVRNFLKEPPLSISIFNF
jgi:hypothetical protein